MSGVYRLNRTANSVGRINTRRVDDAVTPWWLSGGIDPANCIAAFQGKGAEDQATSLINLAAASPSLPTGFSSFNTLSGWYCNGSNTSGILGQYLPYANVNNANISWFIKVAPLAVSTGLRDAFNFRYGGYYLLFRYDYDTDVTSISNANGISVDSVIEGCFGFAGRDAYANGNYIGTVASQTLLGSSNQDRIWAGYAAARQFAGYVHALVFYNTGLSESQAKALTTAMNLL